MSKESRRRISTKQGLISRGNGLMGSGDGREGSLSIRTVRGSGVHLGYKLGNKWYYTKMDSKLEDDEVLLPSRLPKKSGELSIKNGSLYVKRAQREPAKEILTNDSKAKIKALSLTLDDNRVITSSDGAVIHIDAHEVQDNYTGTDAIADDFAHIKLEAPTLSAANTQVRTVTAATLYIDGAPSVGTNQTITDSYDLYFGGDTAKIGSSGDFTINCEKDMQINLQGGQLTLLDKTSGDPDLIILSQNDSTSGGSLIFHHFSSSPAADDILGIISFDGWNDAGTAEELRYARIYGLISDETDGTEAGKLEIEILTKDSGGSGSGGETGLLLEGSNTNDEIDVTIGNGAASLTTIAGDLTVTGNNISGSGGSIIEFSGDDIAFTDNVSLASDTSQLKFGASGEISLQHVSDTGLQMNQTTAATNTVKTALKILHNTSGTPAVGIGSEIKLRQEFPSSNYEDMVVLQGVTTNVGSGTEAADLVIKVLGGGSNAERLRVSSVGLNITGSAGFTQVTATFDATDTDIDFRVSNKQILTLTADIVDVHFQFPAYSGNFLCIFLQDGTGGWDVSNWKTKDAAGNAGDGNSGIVKWAGGSAATLAEAANRTDIISIYWDATNEMAYAVVSEEFG